MTSVTNNYQKKKHSNGILNNCHSNIIKINTHWIKYIYPKISLSIKLHAGILKQLSQTIINRRKQNNGIKFLCMKFYLAI